MKAFLSFAERVLEKWKYHTTTDPVRRLVAEINRNERLIRIEGDSFTVLMCGLRCDIALHGFLLYRFDVFRKLCAQNGARFEIVNSDLIYFIEGLQLRVTTHEELFIIDEIFLQNIYSIEVPESEYNMVDIGMNVGFASLFFARKRAVKKVFAYEPFIPTYRNALANLDLNPAISEKIQAFNIGLGLKDQVLNVPYSKVSKGKNSMANQTGDSMERIQIKNASEVIHSLLQQSSGDIFYIKMDCEGAESDIFQCFIGQTFPAQIKGILLEWHKSYPQEIVMFLNENGFRIQNRGGNNIGMIAAFRNA